MAMIASPPVATTAGFSGYYDVTRWLIDGANLDRPFPNKIGLPTNDMLGSSHNSFIVLQTSYRHTLIFDGLGSIPTGWPDKISLCWHDIDVTLHIVLYDDNDLVDRGNGWGCAEPPASKRLCDYDLTLKCRYLLYDPPGPKHRSKNTEDFYRLIGKPLE